MQGSSLLAVERLEGFQGAYVVQLLLSDSFEQMMASDGLQMTSSIPKRIPSRAEGAADDGSGERPQEVRRLCSW